MSSSSYLRSISRSCIDELNKTISRVEMLVNEIPKNKVRNELETKLMVAKVKRERYEALSTVSRLKTLINELDMWLTQNELTNEIESLKRSRSAVDDDLQPRSKKAKFDDKNSDNATRKHNTSDKNPKNVSNKSSSEKRKPPKASSKSKDQQILTQIKKDKNSLMNREVAKCSKHDEWKLIKISSENNKEVKHNINKDNVTIHSPPRRDVANGNNSYIPTYMTKQNCMYNQSGVPKDPRLIKPCDTKQMRNEQYSAENMCINQKRDINRNFEKDLTRNLDNQRKNICNGMGTQRIVYESDQDLCMKESPELIEQANIIYKEIMCHKAIKLEQYARSVSSIETKKI